MIACNFREYISGASGPNWVQIGFDKTLQIFNPHHQKSIYIVKEKAPLYMFNKNKYSNKTIKIMLKEANIVEKKANENNC